MRIGILTAIWGRPELTRLFLEYYAAMEVPGVDLVRLAVASPEDPNRADLHDDWLFAQSPNAPLSDKWNAGMKAMQALKPDMVMIVGSDDFVTAKYVKACAFIAGEYQANYINAAAAYFYDVTTKRMMHVQAHNMGLGRCVSADLLESLSWKPWPAGLNMTLDGHMNKEIRKCFPRPYKIEAPPSTGMVGMDVKGAGSNIWSFKHVKEHLQWTPASAPEVLEAHFPTIANKLLNWHEQHEPEHADGGA